jgi:hypothetical protein
MSSRSQCPTTVVAQTITKQFTDQPDGPEGRMIWGKRRDNIVRDRLPFIAKPPGSALAGAEITASTFHSTKAARGVKPICNP